MDIFSYTLGKKRGGGSGGGEELKRIVTVTFCDYNGSYLCEEEVISGNDCPNPVKKGIIETPEREQSGTTRYAYSGWSLSIDGEASASALTEVREDRVVYAAFTESAIVASGSCGDAVSWTLCEDGIFYIDGEGAMSNPSSHSARTWADSIDKIITAIIAKGVTSIGDYTFYNCAALTSIDIPEGVTVIGKSAFGNCTALTSIDIPEGVTSLSRTPASSGGAFFGCKLLANVTLPRSLTSIPRQTFKNCEALTSIDIPEGVTSIGAEAFWNCYVLKSVTLPRNLTSIENNAFRDCYSLAEVDIPEGVTSLGYNAFYNGYGLTLVILPSTLKTIESNVFAYSGAFIAVFKDASTWYVTTTSGASSGTTLSSSSLANTETASTYLRSTYTGYYWYKN